MNKRIRGEPTQSRDFHSVIPAVFALYAGVAPDLVKRVLEHRTGLVEEFTNRYSVHHLVWPEWWVVGEGMTK